MVTAEFAVALPAVVLVLALVLGCVRIVLDEVRCVDAARAGARAAARGDDPGAVQSVAREAAPSGSTVTIGHQGGDVVVTVRAPAVGGPVVPAAPAPVAHAVAPAEDHP